MNRSHWHPLSFRLFGLDGRVLIRIRNFGNDHGTGEDEKMQLEILDMDLTICKLSSVDDINLTGDIFFVGKTDEEISLVCKTEDTPSDTVEREDGWKGFRIQGILDFSMIGVLSNISGILADHKIGIFVVSTYNTDYVLVKKEDFEMAMKALLPYYSVLSSTIR